MDLDFFYLGGGGGGGMKSLKLYFHFHNNNIKKNHMFLKANVSYSPVTRVLNGRLCIY